MSPNPPLAKESWSDGRWPMIGRHGAFEQSVSALTSVRTAVVVLSGSAGVGKTRLAGEIMHHLEAEGWQASRIVASAGLGTLSIAALTAEALAARSLPLLGVVIGSWPDEPGIAEESNLVDLPAVTGAPLWGRIPAGAGRLSRADFLAGVPTWFGLE